MTSDRGFRGRRGEPHGEGEGLSPSGKKPPLKKRNGAGAEGGRGAEEGFFPQTGKTWRVCVIFVYLYDICMTFI